MGVIFNFGFWIGGPTTLLTRFAEELRRAPAAGGF